MKLHADKAAKMQTAELLLEIQNLLKWSLCSSQYGYTMIALQLSGIVPLTKSKLFPSFIVLVTHP